MTQTKKKPVEYVNNKKFYEAIVAYHESVAEAKKAGKPEPKIPNYIGECIMMIANKLATKPCFVNYSWKEEMISDAIENCFLYFNDYNPEKGQNPFAYFTQVIYYAFLRRIYKEEKNRYTIYKNFQETITSVHETSLLTDSDDNILMPTQLYDNINAFMEKFEAKEDAKKQKRKQLKEGLQKFFVEDTEKNV